MMNSLNQAWHGTLNQTNIMKELYPDVINLPNDDWQQGETSAKIFNGNILLLMNISIKKDINFHKMRMFCLIFKNNKLKQTKCKP